MSNPHRSAVADLPISVGVRSRQGRRVPLNAHSSAELSYFDAHLPLVPAFGTLTWVYVAHRALPTSDRPFALVGGRPSPVVRLSHAAPAIRARVITGPQGHVRTLRVSVRNPSGVPQYQLPVYAVARRAGRPVAAGTVTLAQLGAHRTQTIALPVAGRPTDARFDVVALPTIFQ